MADVYPVQDGYVSHLCYTDPTTSVVTSLFAMSATESAASQQCQLWLNGSFVDPAHVLFSAYYQVKQVTHVVV